MNNSLGIVTLLMAAFAIIAIINTMSYLLVKNESIKAHANLEKLVTPKSMIDIIYTSDISPLFKSDPYYFKDFTNKVKLDQFKESIKRDKYFEVYFSNPKKYKNQCEDIINKYLHRYALLVSESIQLEYMINTISAISNIPFVELIKDLSLTSSDGIHLDPPPLIYSHFSKGAIDKIISNYNIELDRLKNKKISNKNNNKSN